MVAKPQEMRVPGAKCEEKFWEDETNSCGPLYLANCVVRMDDGPTNPGRKHCIWASTHPRMREILNARRSLGKMRRTPAVHFILLTVLWEWTMVPQPQAESIVYVIFIFVVVRVCGMICRVACSNSCPYNAWFSLTPFWEDDLASTGANVSALL